MNGKRIIFGLFISIVFIYLIVWIPQPVDWIQGELSIVKAFFGRTRIDFGHLQQILVNLKIIPLVLAFLVTPAHCLIRAHRWKVMVKPIGRLKLFDGFSIILVSYFANSILPLRIGEIVRGALLSGRIGVPLSSGIGSVAFDRALDMISLLLVIAGTGLLYNLPSEIKQASWLLILISLIIILLVVTLVVYRNPTSGVMERLLGFLPVKLRNTFLAVFDQFTAGFASLKSPGNYFAIIVDTILIWMLYASQVYLVMLAFNFTESYPLIGAGPILAAFVVLIISAVVLSIPSAPAGVGTFHAAVIFSLALFKVGMDEATGFAIIIHAVTIAFYLTVGLLFMWHEGLKLTQLRKIKSDQA